MSSAWRFGWIPALSESFVGYDDHQGVGFFERCCPWESHSLTGSGGGSCVGSGNLTAALRPLSEHHYVSKIVPHSLHGMTGKHFKGPELPRHWSCRWTTFSTNCQPIPVGARGTV